MRIPLTFRPWKSTFSTFKPMRLPIQLSVSLPKAFDSNSMLVLFNTRPLLHSLNCMQGLSLSPTFSTMRSRTVIVRPFPISAAFKKRDGINSVANMVLILSAELRRFSFCSMINRNMAHCYGVAANHLSSRRLHWKLGMGKMLLMFSSSVLGQGPGQSTGSLFLARIIEKSTYLFFSDPFTTQCVGGSQKTSSYQPADRYWRNTQNACGFIDGVGESREFYF